MSDVKSPTLSARPLWKTFLLFLAPMIASNVLQGLQGTINSVFLGRMIGVNALAAVSSFFPILFFFVSFVIGFSNGAAILIGQAFGAKNHERIQEVAGTAFCIGLLAGGVIAIFGGVFVKTLFVIVGTPVEVMSDAISYGRVVLVSMPLLFFFLMATVMLRGLGDTFTPLLALVVSILVGLIVTPALIQGWGGLPRVGIASAAYAGTLSWIIALSWMAMYLRRKGSPLAPTAHLFRHFRINGNIIKVLFRIGIPTATQMVMISIAEAAVLSFVNGYGGNATAAYGTVNQVVNYIQFPALSIAITASILAAQAIGRGDTERLNTITRLALFLNLLLTGALVIVGYMFSRTLIGLFVKDAVVIELAQKLLHITLWSYIVFGWSSAFASVMRASGTVLIPTAISIFSILGIEVVAAYFLRQRFGIEGIWIAYPVAFIAMLLMQSTYYNLVWRKRTITRLI